MKFIKVVVITVMSTVLLSSCSSLFSVMQTEKSVASDLETESQTAMQIQVSRLQAMPNRYKTQTSGHQASANTLSQFQEALLLKQQGNFSQAKDRFMALSEQHPKLSGIWLQLAMLIKEQGQEQEQEKDDMEQKHQAMLKYLKIAITTNPLNYLAHNELALVLRQQGQFQQALRHYDLALKSWPAFAPAYVNRGILYDLYMGEKSLALADYELYQALTNDDSRQLKGWIFDLQRQIKSAQPNEASL